VQRYRALLSDHSTDRTRANLSLSVSASVGPSVSGPPSGRPAGRAYVPLAAIASNDAHFSCVARHENRQTDGHTHTQTQRERGRDEARERRHLAK